MTKLIVTFVAFLLPISASAGDQVLAKIFAHEGVEGTIVVSSLMSGQVFIHNDSRANQRLSPASTFKIVNTLIAIEEKIISRNDDIIKWDGHVYDLPDWNHDQTLESAFKVSCVWCFQRLAHRIGAAKYQSYLQNLKYGELIEPFDETTFWLDGSLKISAVEQVAFLKKVQQRSFPFSPASYETLRQVMLVEEAPAFSLWAKTGWATKVEPKIGWYVGYVVTPKDIWFFALNIDVNNAADLPLRQKLTRKSLQAKGVIE